MIDNYKTRNRKYKIAKALNKEFKDDEFIEYKKLMDKYFSKENILKYKFINQSYEFCYGNKKELCFTYNIKDKKITLLYGIMHNIQDHFGIDDIRYQTEKHSNIAKKQAH